MRRGDRRLSVSRLRKLPLGARVVDYLGDVWVALPDACRPHGTGGFKCIKGYPNPCLLSGRHLHRRRAPLYLAPSRGVDCSTAFGDDLFFDAPTAVHAMYEADGPELGVSALRALPIGTLVIDPLHRVWFRVEDAYKPWRDLSDPDATRGLLDSELAFRYPRRAVAPREPASPAQYETSFLRFCELPVGTVVEDFFDVRWHRESFRHDAWVNLEYPDFKLSDADVFMREPRIVRDAPEATR